MTTEGQKYRRRTRLSNVSLQRPFEILRLLRDGLVQHPYDLAHTLRDSRFYMFVMNLEEGLLELGLVRKDADAMRPTPALEKLTRSLGLSLTQLSPYTEESVVCSPLFGVPEEPAVPAEVFVLMPFATELRPVYEDHIRSVAKNLNRSVARADDFFAAGSVISDIWNAINACRVIVADCTGRNPNVFYEIGIAHTLGKPVILLAQSLDDVPFDVRHLRAIVYEFTPRGMQEFEATLQSTLTTELAVPSSLEEVIESDGNRDQP
jgi:hypothetical protein